jgi:hypothetical protein
VEICFLQKKCLNKSGKIYYLRVNVNHQHPLPLGNPGAFYFVACPGGVAFDFESMIVGHLNNKFSLGEGEFK